MENYGSVYVVTNRANGREYVGQTTATISQRWASHVYEARRQKFRSKLYSAIRKYGPDGFAITVLCQCADKAELDRREAEEIEKRETIARGYNSRAGGAAGRMSEESRRKMSAARSGPRHFRFGKPLSAEHRAKISKSWETRVVSDETRRKLSEAGMGRAVSAETREKLRAARRGQTLPAHVSDRLRAANLGRPSEKRLPVVCTTTGETFSHYAAAAQACGISRAAICRNVRHGTKLKSGLQFALL